MSARHRPRPAATGGYDAQGYCLKHPMVRMCRPSSSSSSKRHAPSSGTESTADSSGEWIVSACPLCEERGSIYDEPRSGRRGDRDGRGRYEGSSHRSDRRDRDRDGHRDRDRFSDRPPADIDANHGDERPTWKEARRPAGSSFRQLQQRKYEAMEFNRKSGLAGKGRSVPNRHPDRRSGRDWERDRDGEGRRDRDDRALSRGRHPPRSASARRPEIAEEYGDRRRRSESRTRVSESRTRSSSRGYADRHRGGDPRSSSRRLDDDDRERFSRSPARERSGHRGEGRGSSRRLDNDDRERISRSPRRDSRERSKPSGKGKKDRASRSSKDPSRKEKGKGRSQSVSSIRRGAKGAFNKLLAGASQDGQRDNVKKKKKKSSSDDEVSTASSDHEESVASSGDENSTSSSDDDDGSDNDEGEHAKNGTKGESLAARLRQGLEKIEILAKPPRAASEDEEENESDSEEESDGEYASDASDGSDDDGSDEEASHRSESDYDDRRRGGGRDQAGERHRSRQDRERSARGPPREGRERGSRGAPSDRRPRGHRPWSREGHGSSRRLEDDHGERCSIGPRRERSSVSARGPGDSSRHRNGDGLGGSRRPSRDPSHRRPVHRADGHDRGRSQSMSSRRNDDRQRSLSRGVSAGSGRRSGHPRERPHGEPHKEPHRESRRRREPEPIGTHRRPLRGFDGAAVVVGGSGASVVSGITSPFPRHREKGGEDVPAPPGPRLHRSHSRGSSRGRLLSEDVREGRRRSLAADDDDCEVGGSLRVGADCPTNDIPGTIVDGTTEDGECQDVELNPQRVGGGVSDAELNPQRVGGGVVAGAPEPHQPEKPKVKGDEKDLRQLIEWASAELAEQRRQRGLDAHSASVQGNLTYHGGASHHGSMLGGASQNWASASVQGHLAHQGGASHSVSQGQLASSFQGELQGGPLPQAPADGGGQVISDGEPRAAGVVAVMNGAVVDYERARREAIERLQASQRGAIDP